MTSVLFFLGETPVGRCLFLAFHKAHEDSGNLSAGGGAGGIQLAAILAGQQTGTNRPLHGFGGPGGGLGAVSEGGQIALGGHIVLLVLSIAVQDGGLLLRRHLHPRSI